MNRADGTEEAPDGARPRYEQSHPAKSEPRSGSPSHSNMNPTENLTHAATTVTDGGESMYTYDTSRDLAAYFTEIDGRKFGSQASPYLLPADETEFWRLDKQHTAFLVGLGELYPCPDVVERVLAPRPGETIEVVDLGCGTGTWALSMAKRFPHAQVLGIDVSPNPLNPTLLTANIRFEVEDINTGLAHYANRFDLVHMRCVGGGLLDYTQAITYAAQCVKPGGVLIVADLDIMLCAEDMISSQRMATPDYPQGSWLQRYFYEFRWSYAVNGSDVLGADKVLDKGLWEQPLLHGCEAAGVYIPIGPWPKSTDSAEAQRLEFGGILLRQNLRAVLRSCQTLMRKAGIPQDLLDEWVQKCDEELDTLKIHSWLQLRMFWGQRKPTSTTSTQEASTGTSSTEVNFQPSNWVPHRQVHLYHSAEECENARKMRMDTLGEVAKPVALNLAGSDK
ncbi:hypothetical protein M408DRAFT_203865 [Serendipita vermifera MAFF 305830]|uniref:Methyltransferase domain-containing protein n=1 Tax=Serendipita vermifera MAFF 305830 TaxID=933852 RepID=A0A0C2WH97_SERVB|nr:hypothetical protein M408DRAFT_203865 [Serendipita vermifera MAFF 305830]